MEAGGDAGDSRLGEVCGERGVEGVAAAAVGGAHAAEVPVELAAVEKVGERELLETGGALVGEHLRLGDRVDEHVGEDEPAETKGRGEGLAQRAGVDDSIGVEALERADRVSVVAVFGVVVVFDRVGVVGVQPVEESDPAIRGEDDPGRVLMGGCDDDGARG